MNEGTIAPAWLVHSLATETGGDVQEAIDCTYYTAGEGRRLHGFTTPAEMPNKFAMCVRQPVGICGLITPFNFPMAIPSWKLIPALVCGNTVVIKSGEDVPLSTINLIKSCEEAGIPKGVVNLVNGHGAGASGQASRRGRLCKIVLSRGRGGKGQGRRQGWRQKGYSGARVSKIAGPGKEEDVPKWSLEA